MSTRPARPPTTNIRAATGRLPSIAHTNIDMKNARNSPSRQSCFSSLTAAIG